MVMFFIIGVVNARMILQSYLISIVRTNKMTWLNTKINLFFDWFFNTFGERELLQRYLGYGNVQEKRIWHLKIFKKHFYRNYDTDFR
jgi:hypothetical protein